MQAAAGEPIFSALAPQAPASRSPWKGRHIMAASESLKRR